LIPAEFDYVRPETIDEAIAALAEPGAAVLAGGQSLIPDLKVRRKRLRALIDLAGVPGLDSITPDAGAVSIGAMARQAEIMAWAGTRLPLLAEAGDAAADPMIRRRGTLVGACCEAAPGGDWVAAALALDAVMVVVGPAGTRRIPLTDFVIGPGITTLGQGEIAVSIRLRVPPPGTASAYRKVGHIAVGWSIGSVAVILGRRPDGSPERVRVAVSGATAHPQRLTGLEDVLERIDLGNGTEVAEAVEDTLADLEYQGDYYASARFRRKRLAVLLRRTLVELN
jgi:Aerobic-type carbon monoxide dehydrogenase, middle subunit CoxM/CutM homologs